MPFDPARVSELIDRLANGVQTILLLATRLDLELKQSARDAVDLLDSASKATTALQEFRRDLDRE